MQFPEEARLLAMGKYSFLGAELRTQIERMQGICTTITTAAHAVLRDAQASEPEFLPGPVENLDKCMTNLKDARTRIQSLVSDRKEIKVVAWPE